MNKLQPYRYGMIKKHGKEIYEPTPNDFETYNLFGCFRDLKEWNCFLLNSLDECEEIENALQTVTAKEFYIVTEHFFY